ncbi:hypothetical protein GGI59_004043 [Rhizobium lentis]|uniref:Uncharacterized protein n=1 Tax=Rhizobium lentis TaxID=1138194 RepID=A0A7W8XGC2_9HYPH|nr:hypothetical protein [Rhizobium lentis]MBB5551821.1 hypothetical protein [Rhizobium lentis]MBB5562359.1 hypothetical protein [Rhizobium lentis]MBB5568930.1 hypothetical protein [Rhizobium lentis]
MKAPPGAIDTERADAKDQHDRQGEDQQLQRSVPTGSVDVLGMIALAGNTTANAASGIAAAG